MPLHFLLSSQHKAASCTGRISMPASRPTQTLRDPHLNIKACESLCLRHLRKSAAVWRSSNKHLPSQAKAGSKGHTAAAVGSWGLAADSNLGELACRVRSLGTGLLLALLLASGAPGTVLAEIVRVEDVDNPALQAGLEAANDRRFKEAERFFKIFLSEEGSSASAWSNLGNVHLSLGRTLEALEDFTRAIDLAPQAPVPYLNRALAMEQLGVDSDKQGDKAQAADFFEYAVRDCDKAVQLDPKEFAAFFNRGNVEARQQQYESALESYRRAADLAPGIIGYRLRQAELMYQVEGQQQGASRLLRSIIRRNPNFAEAHAALAAAEWQAGHQQAAEEHFAAANILDEHWSEPLAFIKSSMRWPPKLYSAMEDFVKFAVDIS